MKISFTKLGEEECEVCMIYALHEPGNNNVPVHDVEECEACREHQIHVEKSRVSIIITIVEVC